MILIYPLLLQSAICLHFRINTQRKPIIRKQTEAIEENDSVLEKLWSGDRRLVRKISRNLFKVMNFAQQARKFEIVL